MQLKGYIIIECIFKNKTRTLHKLWYFTYIKLGLSFLIQPKLYLKIYDS